jgi:hypothetical protein
MEQQKMRQTENFREVLRAFLEKRKPNSLANKRNDEMLQALSFFKNV